MSDNTEEICYICCESSQHLHHNIKALTTKYSGTLVYTVLERFMDWEHSANISILALASVCQDCMVKLNDYDAAYTKALIIQKEFTDMLKKNGIFNESVDEEEDIFLKEENEIEYLDELEELELNPEEEADQLRDPDRECVSPLNNVEPKLVVRNEPVSISLKCNVCDKKFASIKEMQMHSHVGKKNLKQTLQTLKIEKRDNTYEIDYADYEQYVLDAPDTDDGAGDALEEERIEVDDSYRKDITQELLEVHMEALTSQYSCAKCGMQFAFATQRNKHVKSEHGQKFVCKVCGMSVKTRSALMSHEAKHSRSRHYKCPECAKVFTQKGALQRHMPIHTGERPYQCDKCGKQFIHYSSFHMHKLTHDKIRQKKCEICGYMLMSGSHLARHMRVHSGEKPFACPTCGQKFAQRYNMITHQKAHQGIFRENTRLYLCTFCESTFHRRVHIQEHLSRMHNVAVNLADLKRVKIK